MNLSIITINWNNREGLRQTMDNVLSQTARTNSNMWSWTEARMMEAERC